MSRFYVGGSTSASSDEDDDNLPFPTPLQRSDFLAADFSPSTYLSTLRNRHQTLEDLRSELRSRSQELNKELLDLVNSNYQDFLSLGSSLKGGDEKVEEVRVGLLGFRKDVEAAKGKVEEREEVVKDLVDERVRIRNDIAIGRALVDYEERLRLLEGRLRIETRTDSAKSGEYDDSSESEEDSDDDEGLFSSSVSKLRNHVQQYCLIQQIAKSVGETMPFITAQAPRVVKVRNTILLDLNNALRQAKAAGAKGSSRVMKIARIYADMDESAEAIKVLKSAKTS
ncbi:hypothetical protein BU24DRAFT_416780 [Aaosphaeria arxii CBS 175.79]|uniref:Conserved oligomeric Golgi complex subunit 2 n=1 Tax=Aaosphaeria arxii CBS 175.79 TaxID=1450172 RepID=A0A6A5Y757_9PLEO|nr:uncharacterized protein BU24DRAFT_416780 [Aaosphaeria arxii CBS 175.79]KAF2021116.1 hypothetical protein BU24DRAFT_416780 [Aaosphaeria arxii CBS 175.79]